MPPQRTIFAQITDVLFPSEFARCQELFPSTRETKGLSHYDHFLALCFAQLTFRESLRGIVTCLNAHPNLLYHLGFRGKITRTNLAYANHNRDPRLFAAVAKILIRRAVRLYENDSLEPGLPQLAFALDSSIIDLTLKLCPWGYWPRTQHAAVKLHLLLSLKGNLPVWGAITEASFPDMKMLDQIPVVYGAFYIMDRGYLDFARLHRIHEEGGFFVVRSKRHVRYTVVERRPVPAGTNIRSDQIVRLRTKWSAKLYPELLRKVTVYDPEHKVTLVLVTNNMGIDAIVVGDLYRNRWQVELFFKWIKQHLSIRAFYGRSENAVSLQIWSAICAYLMVAIIKKTLNVNRTLYEVLQIISVSALSQVPLVEALTEYALNIQPQETQKCFVFNDL